jgi:hypothetical protein
MADDALRIPVPLNARDRRGAERFVAAMPVSVDGLEGTTNDLSATGLSFIADRAYEPGAQISVVIEYLLDGHKYPLECQAEVVRVDRVDEGYRIGARLAPQSQMQDIAVPAEQPRHLRPIE